MITTRSSLLSNGRWTGRLAESNGTIHSITRNAASIHGRIRVVFGHIPPSSVGSRVDRLDGGGPASPPGARPSRAAARRAGAPRRLTMPSPALTRSPGGSDGAAHAQPLLLAAERADVRVGARQAPGGRQAPAGDVVEAAEDVRAAAHAVHAAGEDRDRVGAVGPRALAPATEAAPDAVVRAGRAEVKRRRAVEGDAAGASSPGAGRGPRRSCPSPRMAGIGLICSRQARR